MYLAAQKQKLVDTEKKRLERLVTANTALARKLINQSAWLAVSISELEADINDNGYTEMFQQSPNAPAYERERPAVKQIATFQKNYLANLKLLATNFVAVVEDKKDNDEEEFAQFCQSK